MTWDSLRSAVDGNLEAARAALAERQRRKRAGEPVAPARVTFEEFARKYLATQPRLRPTTAALYEAQLGRHVYPRFGRFWIAEISEDDIIELIADLRGRGLSGHSIRNVLTPLSRVLAAAVRKRLIPRNPIHSLERGELPVRERREMRILGSDEIGRVIAAADQVHRPLIATAIFTGLRQSELLGLTWADVDLDGGLVKVRKQLNRDGQRVPPKTEKAVREVEAFPALVRLLRERRRLAFARGLARPEDYVFASRVGTPLGHRNVTRRGLEPAVKAAGIEGRLRFHDLRHTFASILIDQGANVLFVSRQLGHSSASITLDVYGHLFDRREHGRRMRDGLERDFGDALGNAMETSGGVRWPDSRMAAGGEMGDLRGKRD